MAIAAGCTTLVILFVLVIEMILKSTEMKAEMKAQLKAFMDDINVLSEVEAATRSVEEAG